MAWRVTFLTVSQAITSASVCLGYSSSKSDVGAQTILAQSVALSKNLRSLQSCRKPAGSAALSKVLRNLPPAALSKVPRSLWPCRPKTQPRSGIYGSVQDAGFNTLENHARIAQSRSSPQKTIFVFAACPTTLLSEGRARAIVVAKNILRSTLPAYSRSF